LATSLPEAAATADSTTAASHSPERRQSQAGRQTG